MNLSEHFLEVFDGLMLGGARLLKGGRFRLRQSAKHVEWVRMVADEFVRAGLEVETKSGLTMELRSKAEVFVVQRGRWYTEAKVVPRDVRLTPPALAHWFSGNGTRASNGYSVRFCTHSFERADVEFLARRLSELYAWEPGVFQDGRYWVIRLSRSGDRLGLRRLVVGLVPRCFLHKLVLKESAPCSPEEAARRRKPRKYTLEDAAEVRRRVMGGDSYAAIGAALDMSERMVGRIARAERWRTEGTVPIRRRRPVRRLSAAERQEILRRLDAGESQRSIARSLGVSQPRVSWVKRRFGTPI